MIYPRPTSMPMNIVVIPCIVHPSDHPWDWVWVLWTNRLEEMANILVCWCNLMIYPHTPSMPMGIVAISCVRPSVKLSMSVGFGIADTWLGRKSICWHADISRWLTLSLSMLVGIIVQLFIRLAIWVWVGLGDGCCHHCIHSFLCVIGKATQPYLSYRYKPHSFICVILICITHVRAWCMWRDACWDSYLAVSFEVGGGENACTARNSTYMYLVRSPW